jgi:hypothetical protein
MLKYVRSEKGMETRKKYLARNYDEVREYHRAYNKKRRIECRQRGICIKCYKNKMEKGVFCLRCYNIQKIFFNKRKKDEEKTKKNGN